MRLKSFLSEYEQHIGKRVGNVWATVVGEIPGYDSNCIRISVRDGEPL